MTAFEQEAEQVARYLEVRTARPERVDVVFVFGTRDPEPAYIAATLVGHGIVETVVLTGGNNRLTGAGEAGAHLRMLMGRDVPGKQIMVEHESANTLENVTFALPNMRRCLDLTRLASIMVITKWYHCRRAVMTLRRHSPPGIRYYAILYEPRGIGRADLWRSEEGHRRVLEERHCIPRYLTVGHIEGIRQDAGAYV